MKIFITPSQKRLAFSGSVSEHMVVLAGTVGVAFRTGVPRKAHRLFYFDFGLGQWWQVSVTDLVP